MLGATGALIGFGAVMTREQVGMIEAWQAGRIDEARALGVRVQRLADVVFATPVGDYRVRLKECLRILGVLEAAARPPAADADRRRGAGFLAEVLVEVGLLPATRAASPAPGDGADPDGPMSGGGTGAMAAEPADVLIVGAGASGGVVALRLAAGRVQGRLPRAGRLARPGRLPGQQARLGAEGAQGLGDQPEHPRPRARLPDRRGRHAGLAAHVQRGRRLDDHLRRRLAAGPAVGLPGPLARRHRRRLADRLLRAPAVLLPDRPPVRHLGPAGRSRPIRPIPRTRRCRRCRSARPG